MATALAGPASDTGQALAAGEILDEQATTIVTEILHNLPGKATPMEDYAFSQKVLLEAAADLHAKNLRKLKRSLHEGIDPDGPEPTEDRKPCTLHIRDNHDGTETCTWTDTAQVMAMLRAVTTKHYAPVQGEPDQTPRTPGQCRADALREAIALVLRTGQLPKRRGQRPHIHVTVTAETLKGEPGAPPANTSTGQVLTQAQVQRIACDADLTAIVLNGKGVPLWVGRKYRTVTPGQWSALVVRDSGCVFHNAIDHPTSAKPIISSPGNKADPPTSTTSPSPASATTTSPTRVGGSAWDLTAYPKLFPPVWVDPQQRPRRNEYWRIQRQLTLGIDFPRV